MPKKRKPTKKAYRGYTAKEEDLLRFAKWVLLIAFMFLVVAAIITTSTKLMAFSAFVGIFFAYGVRQKWFDT